jgi:hypothetical protein
MHLAGWGEWVFARPGDLGAGIVLGEEMAGTYWIADQRQELVAEVAKAAGERLKVAVRPGSYRVVQPEGRFARVAEVNLAFGGERVLRLEDFVRIPATRPRLRGGEPIVVRPAKIAAGYALAGGLVEGTGPQHHAELALAREWPAALARIRAGASQGSFRGPGLTVTQRELHLAAGAAWQIPLSIGVGGLGVEGQVSLVGQVVARDDAEQVKRVLGVTEPDRLGVVWGGGPFAFLSVPLDDRLWVSVEIAGHGVLLPYWDGTTALAVVPEARAALSWAF